MELWKDIPSYEGLYQASNMGNIRTCADKTTYTKYHGARHWQQRVLKQKLAKRKGGKLDARVSLWKNGREQTWLVARLIGLTWCEGFSTGMTINHINGNTLDNRAENLEWVTIGENIRKSFKTGLHKKSQHAVLMRKKNGVILFPSMAEAGRYLGRNVGYVSLRIKRGGWATAADGTKYEIVKVIR